MTDQELTDEEVEGVVVAMLHAIERHGEETGHDVSEFTMPKDSVRPFCHTCGAVMFDGPELEGEPDA